MPGTFVNATADTIEGVEEAARKEARERAASGLGGDVGEEDIHVRDLLPQEDLEPGDDNDWDPDGDGAFQWSQEGLEQGENVTYVIDSDENAENKVIVLYMVLNTNDSPLTEQVEVRAGKRGQLGIRDHIDVQGYLDGEDTNVLFAEGATFRVKENAQIIQHVSDADGGDDNLILGGVVAEEKGNTLTPRSDTRE